ncbi:MAG: hypothetical protein GF372_06750 [Candidatus Marinimicrobia bacterium]|nr:hypothetical protein [Candidatus Neomarinimicrobiota bacterium]
MGRRTRTKGKVLLDKLPELPAGLRQAVQFPLIEAIQGRRSRRFPVGAEIPEGTFKFKSSHEPEPLTELEQMMVLTAVAGNTGWLNLIPYNDNYLPNIPNYASAAGGRTFPSAAGFHTTEFFYTDDNGTYFMGTRDAESLMDKDKRGQVDLYDYLEAHKKRIKKISDQRLHIPNNPAHIEMHNPWVVNTPGTTLIIPVADLAQHQIAVLCYIVQNGAIIYDDVLNRTIPGIEQFSHMVDIEHPYPLTYLEQFSMSEVTVELSTSSYAGALTLQAMGLGGWMFDGITPLSIMGASGDPEVPGLGFHFEMKDGWSVPNATGLDGVFEGFTPPHYSDMRTAVEAYVHRKFGEGGPFNSKTPGPYKNNPETRGNAKIHNEEFIDCVTTMAQYTYDTFGKFPGTVPSMHIVTYLQAHHLELDYYDIYFTEGGYLDTHANHMDLWHGKKRS